MASSRPYLHSHMLAVKQGYRDRGLGFRLKMAQREEALTRGIRLIQWTFDPLEIKNAFLNISKLGAIARTYHVDFYGVSSSRLQGGLPH
jgi:predicted GNAT superfamily acetyltransferase